MSESQLLNENSPAVQTHLTMMQGVINRMGENSRSCKVWCVTLVAAVLVLVARTGEPQHALIALAPTVLFWVLDAYYLSMERRFRSSHKVFVSKVHKGQLSTSDLFTVAPCGSTAREFLWAVFKSFSVLPFYLMVIATVLLAWWLVL